MCSVTPEPWKCCRKKSTLYAFVEKQKICWLSRVHCQPRDCYLDSFHLADTNPSCGVCRSTFFKNTDIAMYSDEQDSHGLLTLHYGKHHATIVDEIKTCFTSENFADLTFICDDKTTLSAHKLIMASASPLVRRILGESVHANGPSVVLIPGIKSCHLRHLLDFLYHGQACIKVAHPLGNANFRKIIRFIFLV